MKTKVTEDAKPTPGPWEIAEYAHGIRIASKEGYVVVRDGGVIAEADARLIAAAPDLLAALRELLAHHDSIPAQHITEHGHQRADEARAAIAKAGGK